MIEVIFPEFEAEPLLKLLEWCDLNYLSRKGDCMEKLFIPAFSKTEDSDLRERLRNRFIKYFNDMANYKEEMMELLTQIEDTGEEEVGKILYTL